MFLVSNVDNDIVSDLLTNQRAGLGLHHLLLVAESLGSRSPPFRAAFA